MRARVEHVFAAQKRRLHLVIRTIGLARATTKITLANLAYNMRRPMWIEGCQTRATALPAAGAAKNAASLAAQSASPAAKTPLPKRIPRKISRYSRCPLGDLSPHPATNVATGVEDIRGNHRNKVE